MALWDEKAQGVVGRVLLQKNKHMYKVARVQNLELCHCLVYNYSYMRGNV